MQMMGERDNINTITIWCDTLAAKKVRCTFVSTHVRKPSPEEIRKKIADIDKPDIRADLINDLRKCKAEMAIMRTRKHELTGRAKRFFELFDVPCEMQAPDGLVAAMKRYITEVESRTCSVRTLLPKDFVFTQQNESSWESIDMGTPERGGTVVMTLWKEPTERQWNYREVRAGAVGCKNPLGCRHPGVIEYRWREPTPDLECQYVSGF